MTVALVTGQTAGNVSASATTIAVTLPNNPTTGNFVVVGTVLGVNTGTLTVSDSNSNAYAATTKTRFSGAQGNVGIYYLKNTPANATKTINISITGGATFIAGWAAEFSGVDTSAPLENDATADGSGGSPANTPSITTANNGDLLIGVCCPGNAVTAAGSPWTLFGGIQSGNAAEYYIQTTAGAQAVNFTISGTNWSDIEAAFKAATGGGAAASLVIPHRPLRIWNRKY